MIRTKVYKCPKCGSILVMPSDNFFEQQVLCTVCKGKMIGLSDDFDLSELISADVEEA